MGRGMRKGEESEEEGRRDGKGGGRQWREQREGRGGGREGRLDNQTFFLLIDYSIP
jgi:hypothetical protein